MPSVLVTVPPFPAVSAPSPHFYATVTGSVSPVQALMPPVLTPASTSPGFYATSLLCHQSRLLCYQSDVSPVQASMPLELAPATVSPTQASMPPVPAAVLPV